MKQWILICILILSGKVTLLAQPAMLESISHDALTAGLTAPSSLESRYYLLKAERAYFLQSYEEAFDYAREAIRLTPGYLAAYVMAGDALAADNKSRKALKYYKQALDKGLNDHTLLYKIGETQMGEEVYEAAIESYTRAIGLAPKKAEYRVGRGNAYIKLKNYAAAIEDFKAALEINPGLADAYEEMGFAFTQLGNYQEAINNLNKALALTPKDGIALYKRGITYFKAFNTEKACEDWQQAEALGIEEARALWKEHCK